MAGVIVTVPAGYQVLLYQQQDVAVAGDNYCFLETTAQGPLLHLVAHDSAAGQQLAAWLAQE